MLQVAGSVEGQELELLILAAKHEEWLAVDDQREAIVALLNMRDAGGLSLSKL